MTILRGHPEPGRRRRRGRTSRPACRHSRAALPVDVRQHGSGRRAHRRRPRRRGRAERRGRGGKGCGRGDRGGDRPAAEPDRREGVQRSPSTCPAGNWSSCSAIVATGTPTVAVLMSGRPLDLRWAQDNVPAILQVWYPGTRGGDAVAAVLFGDVSPGGKLPFSWPRHVGQVPMILSHYQTFQPEEATKTVLAGAVHPALSVRSRPVVRGRSATRTWRCRPTRSPLGRRGAGVGGCHQHLRGRRRRGGAALHPPALRHLQPSDTGAEGLRAGGDQGRGHHKRQLRPRPGPAALLELR